MAEKQSFMRVDEVAQELGVSKSYAYKIVQKLNAELKRSTDGTSATGSQTQKHGKTGG